MRKISQLGGEDSFTCKATDGAPPRAPTINSVGPVGRRVSPAANVTATFSEAMDAATITTATVKLVKKGARSPVRAKVTYSPATNRATLDPARPLAKGATYTAKVTTGAKDPAGNALAKARAWSFTVRK